MKVLEESAPGGLQLNLERNGKRGGTVVRLLGVFLSLLDGGPY
jgi:hypothetical protein